MWHSLWMGTRTLPRGEENRTQPGGEGRCNAAGRRRGEHAAAVIRKLRREDLWA